MTEAKPATDGHYSSCAVHNMPAYPTGPCDCGLEDRLRATIDTERAARLAAEARADKYRHELWMRETGTSYTDVSDANPNGTFSKRHCFLCDVETRKGASQDTPIPHKPGCLLFGYEPTLALNEHANG